jgi:hypothetical protein
MTRGYILIARGILDHPRFKPTGPYTRAEAWLWLIEAAAFKDRSVPVLAGRQRKMISIARGELSHSVRYLAKAWQWSTNRVLRFLGELQTDNTIETRTETGQTIISLCNYEAYQAPFQDVETQMEALSDTPPATNKKERKGTKNNTCARAAVVDEGFAEWYALYPRKKQLGAALRAYRKVIDGGKTTQSDLLTRTREFATEWSKRAPEDRRFIPYPASWLNAGGYLDEAEIAFEQTPAIAAPTKSPIDFTELDWRKRLEFLARSGSWAETEWGPAPGKPGCLVPAALSLKIAADHTPRQPMPSGSTRD